MWIGLSTFVVLPAPLGRHRVVDRSAMFGGGRYPHVPPPTLEQKQRVQAALARRQAGLAKARIGDEPPVVLQKEEDKDVRVSTIDKLAAHTYVGMPVRMVKGILEERRAIRERAEAKEAQRVWEMLQIIERGTRVKLRGLGRIGGVNMDGKLATVFADFGSRYAVRLDLVERDGAVREGMGKEVKVSPSNMEIYDAEVERILAEEDAERKCRARERRAAALAHARKRALAAITGRPVTPLEDEDADAEEDEGARPRTAEAEAWVETKRHIEWAEINAESTLETLMQFHAQARATPAPRTKWTRRVPHPVLIGHGASLTPY